MFTRLLVPLDGSERAEQALPVAARIARATHGRLVLVQVVSNIAAIGADAVAPVDTLRIQLEAAESYLRGLAQRDELKDVTTSIKALAGTPIADEILDLAEIERCDLLVLCSHGRTGLARWALGSVAERLVHHAGIPVLVLRSGGASPTDLSPDADHPLQALVPLDGSALAEAAIVPAAQLAAALAAPYHGALHLLQVLNLTYIGTERGKRVLMDHDTREAVRENARAYLDAIAKRLGAGELGALGLRVSWSVCEDVDAATSIIEVAEGEEGGEGGEDMEAADGAHYDLICLATHGRGGFQRWMLGSVTERVLRTTKLPLLVVRPQAQGT